LGHNQIRYAKRGLDAIWSRCLVCSELLGESISELADEPVANIG
jgi:hypothetical protein